MSAAEDLDAVCLILETMLELHQADRQSVTAALRLVKGALAELGDKPAPADDEESPPDSGKAITEKEFREAWTDEDAKARAMDLQFGMAALDTSSSEYADGIQVLGAHRYGDK